MSIDFRKSASVLTAVHKFAKPKERTNSNPYVVDGYELHARPELADRLKDLMERSTPGARLEFAFGIPMLCTATGRVFATAGGTHSLSLFLPKEQNWGNSNREYGEPWRQGYAWTKGRRHTPADEEQLTSLLRHAYAAAMKMDAGVESSG